MEKAGVRVCRFQDFVYEFFCYWNDIISYQIFSFQTNNFMIQKLYYNHTRFCNIILDVDKPKYLFFYRLPMQQQYTQESVNVLQQLVSMCRENSVNCRVLAKAGMISQLLGGMKLILGQRNSKLTGKFCSLPQLMLLMTYL